MTRHAPEVCKRVAFKDVWGKLCQPLSASAGLKLEHIGSSSAKEKKCGLTLKVYFH